MINKVVLNSHSVLAAASKSRSGLILATIAAAAGLSAAWAVASPATAGSAAGFIYTADEIGDSVSRIDLATGMIDIFPIGITGHNVQFLPGKARLLVVGVPTLGEDHKGHDTDDHAGESDEVNGRLLVLDTEDMAAPPVASVTVGAHPAHVIADAAGSRAYVTNSEDDTVSVVDLAKGQVIATVPTGDYPHGLRMSPDGSSIYIANVEDGTVSVIDAISLVETGRIEVGPTPVQVGFIPDGSQVYVSLRDENKVAVIDTAEQQVISRVDVGRSPIQMHATPDGRYVYVANQGTETEPDDRVSVIDVASGKVIETIKAGAGAHGATVSSDGAFVFVTNIVDNTVSEISVADQAVVRTHKVGKGPNGITFQTP